MASKENWVRFCTEFPDIKLSYLDWSNIIYTFNYNFRDHCLDTGEVTRLPWGFGDVCVSKKKRKKVIVLPNGQEKINLAIDWKNTKKAGKRIYHFNHHTNGFYFKWKWFPQTGRFRHHTLWVFRPSRLSSRMINHYVRQEGQPAKYREWDNVI